jgi:general secretion pathway protein G
LKELVKDETMIQRAEIRSTADLSRLSFGSNAVSADTGWTLIELLMVVSMITILATVSMTQYRNSVQSAKEVTLKSDLLFLRDAIAQYCADKNECPDSLQTLVFEGYLRAIPTDPFTRSSDTWQTAPAESQPGNLTTSPGINYVRSGSNETSLDGSRYSAWGP